MVFTIRLADGEYNAIMLIVKAAIDQKKLMMLREKDIFA